MNPADQQPAATTQGQTTSGGGGGDMLDKGVHFAAQKSGHQQKPGTTEKVSCFTCITVTMGLTK